MDDTSKKILNQLSQVLTIIPTQYVDTLLVLHKRLGKDIRWAVGGDLAENLQVVKVEADCVEILTSKEGAEQIFQAVQEFKPEQISFRSWQLPRNAVIVDKEYPVYARSYNFEFSINSVKVKVQGDLQYKIDNWDWGDKLEFEPDYVYIVGEKIPVMPLSIKYELYQRLGWVDRVEKIGTAISNRRRTPKFRQRQFYQQLTLS